MDKFIDDDFKLCHSCGEVFLKTEEFFARRTNSYGQQVFQTYCRTCGVEKSKKYYREHKGSEPITLNLKPLPGNRCCRCKNPLEKRELKYDSRKAESDFTYLNCVFCGQDYYPETEELLKCA